MVFSIDSLLWFDYITGGYTNFLGFASQSYPGQIFLAVLFHLFFLFGLHVANKL